MDHESIDVRLTFANENPDPMGRRTLNEVSDRNSTNCQAIASLTNLSLDARPITAAPSIFSTVEDDFEGYSGLAEAAEKLTNTCQRPDERLSHVVASSQYHRVAAQAHKRHLSLHIPYLLSERKAFLGQRHKARLALALEPVPVPNSQLDEIELGAMSTAGLFGNHDQKLAPRRITQNTALQRYAAAVMDRLMKRSCAWFLLGFWAVLILSTAVPM